MVLNFLKRNSYFTKKIKERKEKQNDSFLGIWSNNIMLGIKIRESKVGIRQEHKEHCSAYFAAYNSVTNSVNRGSKHRLFQTANQMQPSYNNDW